MIDYSYIGVGKIYLKDNNNADAGLVHIGNCSKLEFAVDEETKTLVDYTTTGGGTLNEVRRVKGVDLSMTLHNLSPENVSMALYGTTSAVAAGTVATAESVTAIVGALSRLAYPNPTNVVVKDATDTTTYTLNEDYEVSPGGITPLAGGDIETDDVLHVTYSYGAFDLVQALAGAAGEYLLFFEGLNEARSGKPVLIDVWRARFGAAKNIGFIGQDYAELAVEGKVLKDNTKSGGVSTYFRVAFVE